MSDDELPQSDQIDGAPHPRDAVQLFGQQAAEAAFLEAFTNDRLHHAWMISGPRGVGKATLAWRIARFLLANPPVEDDMFGAPPPPKSLDVDPEHPLARRIAAQSEPGLFLLRRLWDADKKRFKQNITVDEVRKLKGFFSMSATDGGRRVVIVDAADDMNVNAANALLKLLEEPPKDALLILISHQPSRLLPTIRSRCRELRCGQLAPEDMAQALQAAGVEETGDSAGLAELSGGSVGEALALINLDGLALYKSIIALAATFPNFDRQMALRLGETAAARGAEARLDLLLRLFDVFLARVSRKGAGVIDTAALEGELEILSALSPDADAARAWATLASVQSARMRHGRAVNLDPSSLILDMVLAMNETAARIKSQRAA